jgi:ssDNA-binding Zn-finger/Zn-ribbon topoisomerase 1
MDKKIGRLQKTLKEECPDCGKLLQLRVIEFSQLFGGENVGRSRRIKYCPSCEYSEDLKEKLVLNKDFEY